MVFTTYREVDTVFNFPPDAAQVWFAFADKTMFLWAPALALTIAYAVWEVSQKAK